MVYVVNFCVRLSYMEILFFFFEPSVMKVFSLLPFLLMFNCYHRVKPPCTLFLRISVCV